MDLYSLNVRQLRQLSSFNNISSSRKRREDLVFDLQQHYSMNGDASSSGRASAAKPEFQVSFRELQRQRHEQRANQSRRQAQEVEDLNASEERAREEEERLRVELAEQKKQELLLLVENILTAVRKATTTVQSARAPREAVSALQEVNQLLQEIGTPITELSADIAEIQAEVASLLQALNTNQNYVVLYGSEDMNAIYTLMGDIGSATGVEFELQAPIMNTDEDEMIARELESSLPQQSAAAASSSSVRSRDFSVPIRRLVNDYSFILIRLKSLENLTLPALREILEDLQSPTDYIRETFIRYRAGQDRALDLLIPQVTDLIDQLFDFIYDLDSAFSVLQVGRYVELLDDAQKVLGH